MANIGNFIHRTLTFVWTRFNRKVPQAEKYDDLDKEFEEKIKGVASDVAEELENVRLDKGLSKISEFSSFCNQYFQRKQPWARKENAKTCLYLCANAVRNLAILLSPYLPSSAEKAWQQLNLEGSVHKQDWNSLSELTIKSGHEINKPRPLFKKVEISDKEETQKKLEKRAPQEVSIEEFSKLNLRVGKIVKAESIPKSKKLVKLVIDIGNGELRQAVAGIAPYYALDKLEGMRVIVITNLQRRQIFGVKSEVMVLAAEDEKTVALLQPDRPVKVGSRVK